jgi:hypothetical protein
MIGRATSGPYGYTMGKSYALACVNTAQSQPGQKRFIKGLDNALPATVAVERRANGSGPKEGLNHSGRSVTVDHNQMRYATEALVYCSRFAW